MISNAFQMFQDDLDYTTLEGAMAHVDRTIKPQAGLRRVIKDYLIAASGRGAGNFPKLLGQVSTLTRNPQGIAQMADYARKTRDPLIQAARPTPLPRAIPQPGATFIPPYAAISDPGQTARIEELYGANPGETDPRQTQYAKHARNTRRVEFGIEYLRKKLGSNAFDKVKDKALPYLMARIGGYEQGDVRQRPKDKTYTAPRVAADEFLKLAAAGDIAAVDDAINRFKATRATEGKARATKEQFRQEARYGQLARNPQANTYLDEAQMRALAAEGGDKIRLSEMYQAAGSAAAKRTSKIVNQFTPGVQAARDELERMAAEGGTNTGYDDIKQALLNVYSSVAGSPGDVAGLAVDLGLDAMVATASDATRAERTGALTNIPLKVAAVAGSMAGAGVLARGVKAISKLEAPLSTKVKEMGKYLVKEIYQNNNPALMIPAGIRGKVADALTFGNTARQSITLEIIGKAKNAGVDNATLVEIKRGLDSLNPIEFDAVVKSDGALDEITQRFKAAPGIRENWTKNLTDQEGPLDIEEGAITPDIIAGLKTVSQDAREKLIAERAQRAAPAPAPPSPTPKPAGRTRKPKPAEPVVKVEEEPVVAEAPKPAPKKVPAKKPANARQNKDLVENPDSMARYMEQEKSWSYKGTQITLAKDGSYTAWKDNTSVMFNDNTAKSPKEIADMLDAGVKTQADKDAWVDRRNREAAQASAPKPSKPAAKPKPPKAPEAKPAETPAPVKSAEPVKGGEVPASPKPEFKLPKELEKSAPRYGRARLEFESDYDRTAYILARDAVKPSKSADKFRDALEAAGESYDDAVKHGEKVIAELKRVSPGAAPQVETTIKLGGVARELPAAPKPTATPKDAGAAPVAPVSGGVRTFDLMRDGIEGEEIPWDTVESGSPNFQYALGSVERGDKPSVFRRRANEEGTYGGWRWERSKPIEPKPDAAPAPKDVTAPTTPKTGAEMREELLANKPKPKKRLKGGTKAGAINIDPEEIDWYIRYASTYVKDGADWVKQVVNDFGDEVKPYIEEIRKGLIKAGLIAEEERKGPAKVDKGPVKMDNAGTPITVANTPDPLKPVSQGGGIDDETRKIRAEANPMSETQAKGEAMPDSEVTRMVDKIYADPSDKLPTGVGDVEVVAAALAKQMRTVSGQIKEAVLAGNNDKADRLQKKLNRTVVAFRKTQNTAGRGLAGMKVAYDPDELITSDNVADIVGRLSENEDVTKAAAPMVKAATKLLSDAEKGIADATKDKTTIQKAYEELSKENAGLKRTVKTFLDAARDTFVTGEKQITTQERSWAEKNLFISPKNASSKNQASAISVNHKALAILIQDTLENGALTLRDAVQNIQKKFGVTISDEDVANSVAIMRTHNLQREAEKTAARIRKNATSDADIAIANDLVDGAKKLSGKVKQATSPKKSPEPGMEGVHPRHIDAIKAVRDSLEEQDDAIKEFAESLDDTLAKILADGKEQGLATPVKRGFTPEQAKIYGELRRQLNAIKKGATSGKVTTVVTSEWNQELVDAINNAVEVAKDFAKKNNLPDADMVKEWEQLKRGSATADAMLANLPETLDPTIRDQIVTMVANALPGDKLKVAKILLSQYTPKVAKTVAADSKAVSEAREWLAINNAKVVAGANVSNVATLKEAEDLARKIGTANAAINKALGSMNRKDYNALMEQSRQLFDIRRELRNRMSDLNYQLGNKSDTEKAWARAASILNIPRTIKASGDVSFASRQGGALAAANPAIWKHLWGGQMKAVFKNKNNAARYMEDLAGKIRKTEVYDVYSRAIGSSDTKADDSVKFNFDSGGHEEQYEFVPKVVRENAMIRKSDDAYAAAGDIVRWKALEMFHNKLVRHYAKRGMSVPEADIRRVAEFVNIATGKGHGDFAKALGSHPSVGLMFFAPRFRWSRIQYTSLYPGRRAIQIITGVTRKSAQGASFADVLIAGEYLKFMGLRAAQYGTAAALLGAETSMDPDSDLFGKLKMGNFTYDMSGGFAQPMKLGWAMTKGAVAGAQVASSQQDSASREAAFAKGGKAGDDILRTVRGSLSPIPGVVWTMAKGGQTITGQQLAPLNTRQGALDYAEQLFVPITATDMAAGAKQARNDGDPAIVGMAKSLPGAVGIGVSAYERGPQPKTEAEKMVKAIGGTKSFGAMTPRTNEQRVAMTKVTNMLEQKGRPATGQARKMLKAAFPDVAPERINEMVENAAVPTLQKVAGMSLPQMIAVLRVATDAEVLEIHRKAGWGEKLLPGSNYSKEKLMGKGNLPAAEAKKLINEYRDRVKKARGNASRK